MSENKNESVIESAPSVDELVEIAQAAGLTIEPQTSWVRCLGPKGAALYIQNAKRGVRQVNVAGFTPDPHPCMVRLTPEEAKAKHLGNVRGMLYTDKPGFLEAFEALCEEAASREGTMGAGRGRSASDIADRLGK